jgi:hypothetical protein
MVAPTTISITKAAKKTPGVSIVTAVLIGMAKLSVADNKTNTNTFTRPGICRLLNIGALKNKPDNRPSNNKNPSIGNGIITLPPYQVTNCGIDA